MKYLKLIAPVAVGLLGIYWMTGEVFAPPGISVNVEGYPAGETKIAFTTADLTPGTSFEVHREGNSVPVHTGTVSVSRYRDPAFGTKVHELNFSGVNDPGVYRLSVPSADIRSESFRIADRPYRQAARKALSSFRFQRCGTEVGEGTPWYHDACHRDDAVFYGAPERHRNVTGGWHDAGDYGKFSVNTAVSVAYLLYLNEHAGGKGTAGADSRGIPESGNGVADLLDEARQALEWLLRMQRPSDGAVWHKVQKKRWTGEYLPRNDPDPRYIFPVSSTATADFAAVAALASRRFSSSDPAFSDTLARAARRAWRFLERNPDNLPQGGFTNPEDVRGGEYGDGDDSDERLWAAVELYRLTGRQEYHDYLLKHRKACGFDPPALSWRQVGEFACASYLSMPREQRQAAASERMRWELERYAGRLVDRASGSAYRLVLAKDEFYWGSNSVALGYAWTLVRAYEITGKAIYRETALAQLHYVMGRNPFATSFVTGLEGRSVQNPYHQLSMASASSRPVPGMLVGGPNSRDRLEGQPLAEYPGLAWEDNQENYQVNETAINYTAPFVYLAGWFTIASPGSGPGPPGPG